LMACVFWLDTAFHTISRPSCDADTIRVLSTYDQSSEYIWHFTLSVTLQQSVADRICDANYNVVMVKKILNWSAPGSGFEFHSSHLPMRLQLWNGERRWQTYLACMSLQCSAALEFVDIQPHRFTAILPWVSDHCAVICKREKKLVSWGSSNARVERKIPTEGAWIQTVTWILSSSISKSSPYYLEYKQLT
jgi:hypothetical protein